MSSTRPSVFLLAALAVGIPAALAQDSSDPRQDLAALERVLDGAVRQVSRASPAHSMSGAEACRSYALRGYGAVFVLAPRLLPTRSRAAFRPAPGFEMNEVLLERTLRATEEQLVRVSSPEVRVHIQQRLDVLRRTLAQVQTQRRQDEQAPRPAEGRDAEIRALEAQAQAFEREAEQAREEAGQALAQIEREMEQRLPSPASPPPVVPSERTPPLPPMPVAVPVPPWSNWFEVEDPAGRTSEGVIKDVRTAVTNALEAHGGEVRLVRPEEFLVVAVDFFPRGSFGAWERPERTLIVRVMKKELVDRQAGKLPPDELRKRIEYLEY